MRCRSKTSDRNCTMTSARLETVTQKKRDAEDESISMPAFVQLPYPGLWQICNNLRGHARLPHPRKIMACSACLNCVLSPYTAINTEVKFSSKFYTLHMRPAKTTRNLNMRGL